MGKFFEAEILIKARASTVWDVLTDTSNLTVWESGITAISGEMRNGGTIRMRTSDKSRRGLRMRVQQFPGQVMRWQGGVPVGMLRRTLTFVLTEQTGLTSLKITHELSGPLTRFADRTMPASQEVLQVFVEAVRKRAELLDRHSGVKQVTAAVPEAHLKRASLISGRDPRWTVPHQHHKKTY